MLIIYNIIIMGTIRRNGLSFLEMTSENKNEYFIIAKELIENLFFDMSKLSTNYCNDFFCELPYIFSERTLSSILLPALSKLCNSLVFAEMPTVRCCSNKRFKVDETTGRIDYWCIYKGYSFVIEVKHSFDCFTTNKTREGKVTRRWIKMNEQLESIKEDIKTYEEKTKGIIRIGLHFVTSYSDKPSNKELIAQFTQSIPNTFTRLLKDMSKRYPSLRPDMIICWKIPPRIVLDYDIRTFPGLWLMAKIYNPINHFGKIESL